MTNADSDGSHKINFGFQTRTLDRTSKTRNQPKPFNKLLLEPPSGHKRVEPRSLTVMWDWGSIEISGLRRTCVSSQGSVWGCALFALQSHAAAKVSCADLSEPSSEKEQHFWKVWDFFSFSPQDLIVVLNMSMFIYTGTQWGTLLGLCYVGSRHYEVFDTVKYKVLQVSHIQSW